MPWARFEMQTLGAASCDGDRYTLPLPASKFITFFIKLHVYIIIWYYLVNFFLYFFLNFWIWHHVKNSIRHCLRHCTWASSEKVLKSFSILKVLQDALLQNPGSALCVDGVPSKLFIKLSNWWVMTANPVDMKPLILSSKPLVKPLLHQLTKQVLYTKNIKAFSLPKCCLSLRLKNWFL